MRLINGPQNNLPTNQGVTVNTQDDSDLKSQGLDNMLSDIIQNVI